nr:hypothetical protein [Desulfobulbaceae bacterium]
MDDSNIIELTPFRADLTRALARRGERLLASTDLAEDVAELEPLEAYYIVREIGLGQSLPVLLQLSPQQLETCVDLDCWHRYDFAADSLDEWLAVFSLAGPETLAQTFFSLDYVVQLLFLAQTVTVYDPDTDQVPPQDEDDEDSKTRAMTPDGFYLLELKTELDLKVHPFTLLDAMYMFDNAATHQLLSEVRVDLQSQIEEEALRVRNNRMQDIGFVTPDEANVLFSKPTSHGAVPRPLKPVHDLFTGVPSLYATPFIETTLLQRALSLVTDLEFLSRLEQEVVWAINSAIIAYGEKTSDTNQITDIAKRVRDTISLGLESLLVQHESDCLLDGPEAAAKACDLLADWCLTDLFRQGFTVTQPLKHEAQKALREPRFREWYNLSDALQSENLDEAGDQQDRAFVSALLGRHPLRGGFNSANAEEVKAFGRLVDVKEAHERLKQLLVKVCR